MFLAVSFFNSSSMITVYADNTSSNENDKLMAKIEATGVSKETANKLLAKVEKGGVLDSMNPKYNNLAPTFEVISKDKYEATYIYPDGSINYLTIQPRSIASGSVDGGNFQGGSYWYTWENARVSASVGFISASFYANIQGGSGGKITSVSQPGITIVGGTFTNSKLWIQNGQASDNRPAEADLYFESSAVGNYAASTVYLRLYVGMKGMPYARLSLS